jgi:hypothetical protein
MFSQLSVAYANVNIWSRMVSRLWKDIVIYLKVLTYSIELRPFWEAAGRSALPEFHHILRIPKVNLPCSQEPFTSPYSELDLSNPYHLIKSHYEPV